MCTFKEGIANSLVTWSEELQETSAVPRGRRKFKRTRYQMEALRV